METIVRVCVCVIVFLSVYPTSAMGEGPQVCAGSVTIYSTIQQEEICMGSTCRAPRYGEILGGHTIVC